jgi:CheY-like chemotaxis protein
MGCSVSTAENGEIAVNILLGSPDSEENAANVQEFAVVFMDNQMPVMSGLQAITKLRQLGRKDFVVGVTGNALLADQQVSIQINGFVPRITGSSLLDFTGVS